jgi:hypothetical protein
VQGFIPLPGTLAAALYACGVDERGERVYLPEAAERARQKNALLGGSARRTPKQGAAGRPRRKR